MKHQGDEDMPLVKVKEKFQVTIPTALRKAVRLSVGDLLLEFYQLSSKSGQKSEMLGGCLDHPIALFL
jgi:hypothetical protein